MVLLHNTWPFLSELCHIASSKEESFGSMIESFGFHLWDHINDTSSPCLIVFEWALPLCMIKREAIWFNDRIFFIWFVRPYRVANLRLCKALIDFSIMACDLQVLWSANLLEWNCNHILWNLWDSAWIAIVIFDFCCDIGLQSCPMSHK